MTALEKVRNWIATYDGYDVLSNFYCDYTSEVPGNAGLFPTGVTEVERRTDILGNTEVINQLNFALYTVFDKSDDVNSTFNAEWVADFQMWVQEQSIRGDAPTFGDVPARETITAQNGSLFSADDEGTAMYMIQLNIRYIKRF